MTSLDFPRTEIYYNEEGFIRLLAKIATHGQEEKDDRTGVGTRFSFGETVIYELYGPRLAMMTTRFVGFKTVLEELLFFLRGETDTSKLKSNIWKGNTTREFLDKKGLTNYATGTMGPMYGWVWRFAGAKYVDGSTDYTSSGGFDQLKYLLDTLYNDRSSRRAIISSFLPHTASEGVLYPCHVLQQYQFEEFNGKKHLSCIVYQRSADLALAAMSFNALSYSILLNMICEHLRQKGVEVQPGKLVHHLGNAHVYLSHLENVKVQVTRTPLAAPTLQLSGDFSNLDSVSADQFQVMGYESHEKIHYPMSV